MFLTKQSIKQGRYIPDKSGDFRIIFFLVGKRFGTYRPAIKLKDLNKHVPYQHFKMEGVPYLKFLLLVPYQHFKMEGLPYLKFLLF